LTPSLIPPSDSIVQSESQTPTRGRAKPDTVADSADYNTRPSRALSVSTVGGLSRSFPSYAIIIPRPGPFYTRRHKSLGPGCTLPLRCVLYYVQAPRHLVGPFGDGSPPKTGTACRFGGTRSGENDAIPAVGRWTPRRYGPVSARFSCTFRAPRLLF